MNKGDIRNKKHKTVQQKHPTGIVPAAVIFSGVCRGISNQGAVFMIQDTVKRVKLGYNNHRAAVLYLFPMAK